MAAGAAAAAVPGPDPTSPIPQQSAVEPDRVTHTAAAPARPCFMWRPRWNEAIDGPQPTCPTPVRSGVARVAPAAADDGAVGAGREPGRPVEPQALQPGMGPRVEEAAMGGGHQRPAVQELGQGERVEEEVDRVDVDDVGVPDPAEEARRQRIARRAAERHALDRDPVHPLGGREPQARLREQAVEGQHPDVVAEAYLLAGEVGDEILQPAAVRQELADDVQDGQGSAHGRAPQRGAARAASRITATTAGLAPSVSIRRG